LAQDDIDANVRINEIVVDTKGSGSQIHLEARVTVAGAEKKGDIADPHAQMPSAVEKTVFSWQGTKRRDGCHSCVAPR
jgi:hypothetical protein